MTKPANLPVLRPVRSTFDCSRAKSGPHRTPGRFPSSTAFSRSSKRALEVVLARRQAQGSSFSAMKLRSGRPPTSPAADLEDQVQGQTQGLRRDVHGREERGLLRSPARSAGAWG